MEVSHNLLDVAEVLKVDQFPLVTVRCNRAEEGERLPQECGEVPPPRGAMGGPALGPGGAKEEVGVREEVEVGGSEQWWQLPKVEDIWVTVLAVMDMYGVLWILLASLLTLLFLLCYLLHSCCRCFSPLYSSSLPLLLPLGSRSTPPRHPCRRWRSCWPCRRRGSSRKRARRATSTATPAGPTSPTGSTHSSPPGGHCPRVSRQNCHKLCRSNLKEGMLLTSPRPPQYVRVQGVRSEPGEDGVVCGSLTLGPSFAGTVWYGPGMVWYGMV